MMKDFYKGTAILFIALILFEIIYSTIRHQKLFNAKDSVTSLALGILGVVTRIAITSFTLFVYYWLFQYRLFDMGIGAWAWFLCFMANELIYYWFHRWSHEYRFLWATHVNHHSSEYMNFFTATRTPFMNFIHHIIFWIPLPLLGFDPLMVVIVESIAFLFAFLQHTEIVPKLGPLEWFINTPSHHRVHHGTNPQYIDKNYGNTLIIFDKMFGTFEKENEKVVYGITKNLKTFNPVWVVFHEWVNIFRDAYRARNSKERWKFIFGRVGWHPEDQDQSPPVS